MPHRHRCHSCQAATVARRRRCSIIASTPATSDRALPPVAGSISGMDLTVIAVSGVDSYARPKILATCPGAEVLGT